MKNVFTIPTNSALAQELCKFIKLHFTPIVKHNIRRLDVGHANFYAPKHQVEKF